MDGEGKKAEARTQQEEELLSGNQQIMQCCVGANPEAASVDPIPAD